MRDYYQSRHLVLKGLLLIAFAIFALRLFYFQIIDENNRLLAQNNAVKPLTIYPARGLIYDRKGELIVYNQMLYDILVTPKEIDSNFNMPKFCEYLGIDTSYYVDQFKKLKKSRGYSAYKPSVLIKQVSVENYAKFQEHSYEFKGFYAQTRTIRYYPNNCGAHVLGDIGEIDSAGMKKLNDYPYQQGDYVGKNGIEKSYEKYLRGRRGVRTVIVDAFNRIKGSYGDGAFDTLPVAGDELTTTLDIKLQKYGEELLKNKVGSVVAIEPSTGEILALISSPTFDPNILTGRKRGENYAKLLQDKYKPLYNRALKGLYPPGSTFKAMVAMVALKEGAIDTNFAYYCPGYYSVGRIRVHCSHRHSPATNIKIGLMHSCNPYFCQTFRNTVDLERFGGIQQGYSAWYNDLRSFGLDAKTGVDLPSEEKGWVPKAEYYNKMYGKDGWRSATIISLGIGQGEILMTPIQLANAYAAIANEGYYITPHLVKKIRINGKLTPNTDIKKYTINIAQDLFKAVKDGLQMVVDMGTAKRSKIPDISFCGKTGTAQNPHGNEHSLFVGFAPKENPKIVVACVVENAGSGGSYAAPIASLMAEYYLRDSISPKRKSLEKSMLNARLIKYAEPVQDTTSKKLPQ